MSADLIMMVSNGLVPMQSLLEEGEKEQLDRIAPSDFGPNNAPAGAGRPSPRTLSNTLSISAMKTEDERPLSRLGVGMLQFLASHEIAKSPTFPRSDVDEQIDIPLEPGDEVFFDGPIQQSRSQFTLVEGVREQVSDVTSAFDGSTVYGSTVAVRDMLVDRVDNDDPNSAMTGFMRTGPHGGLPEFPVLGPGDNPVLGSDGQPILRVMAGDARADENPTLEALHELFLKEHNRLAQEIHDACDPACEGEDVYNATRYLVAKTQEKIFYEELLPLFLGDGDLAEFVPLQSQIAEVEGALNAFTAAAGRIGHTQIPDTIELALPSGLTGEVPLENCFFDRGCFGGASLEEILYGAARQQSEPVDPVVSDALRNATLPEFMEAKNIDLLATNINRGRDHGLPGYFEMRAALGFDDTMQTPEEILAALLPQHILDAYGYVDTTSILSIFDVEIDLLVGLFSEFRAVEAHIGETGRALWALQFAGLQNRPIPLSSSLSVAGFEDLAEDYLAGVTMSGLLADNTGLGRKDWRMSFVAPVPLPPAALAMIGAFAALAGLRNLKSKRQQLAA